MKTNLSTDESMRIFAPIRHPKLAMLYWQDLLIRHVLDHVHCEKNICKNMLKTIWGHCDTLKARLDLQEARIRPHLHPLPSRNPISRVPPVAPYVLSKEEKLKFLDIICNLKTPTNYVGQIAKCIAVDGDLRGLKSHDYHVLMQQLLPLGLRTLVDKKTQVAIMRLSRVFVRLCVKSVDHPCNNYSRTQPRGYACWRRSSCLPFLMSCATFPYT